MTEMFGQPVNTYMHYKDSTGFTYLTRTFLFCTCIPALRDCSRCGPRDCGCWQPRKYNKTFFIVVGYSRSVRMIIVNVAHVCRCRTRCSGQEVEKLLRSNGH